MFGIGKEEKPSQNSSKAINKIDVRAKLAETAGVSTDTYSKGKKILDSNNEKLKFSQAKRASTQDIKN